MRRVTISPYIYEFEYNEDSCKFSLCVRKGTCKVIDNLQLCIGDHEIIDNVKVSITDTDLDNVFVRKVNQVVDSEPSTKNTSLSFD